MYLDADRGKYLGVKQLNAFPGNNARGLPGLTGHYLLSCGRLGGGPGGGHPGLRALLRTTLSGH